MLENKNERRRYYMFMFIDEFAVLCVLRELPFSVSNAFCTSSFC